MGIDFGFAFGALERADDPFNWSPAPGDQIAAIVAIGGLPFLQKSFEILIQWYQARFAAAFAGGDDQDRAGVQVDLVPCQGQQFGCAGTGAAIIGDDQEAL